MVPAGEVISPGRPVKECTVLNHLGGNIQVEHDFVILKTLRIILTCAAS